ncbi:MAG: hypothetical protein IBX50_04225 [Marinospirillum sp.]|uniref:hypothetical protein n=1 Tax=Marinospirillum sp. TaxID=2183934 RepID=UPI0019D9BFEF|nr:hypothetical protein [Marinospirillum sp.]MBE0505913.1 hypothetical protein [Marinospirillum sp.]
MAVGVSDKSVSPRLMAFIKGESETVVALLGEGATRDLTANWESPFEQDSAGGVFQKTGGLVQEHTGRTSKSTLNSTQVWGGNVPHSFNLPLIFYALSDAYNEVQAAIIALEQMTAPEVNAVMPGGRIPALVAVSVGRMIIYPECHIVSISTDVSGPKSKDGYPLRAEVTLSVQTKSMLNASDIPGSFR